MTRSVVFFLFLFAALLFGARLARSQKNLPTAADRERQRQSLAINLARAINSAEAGFRHYHGTFATWNDLISNGDFTDHGTKWAPDSMPVVSRALYGPGPEIVPGWKLRLFVTENGTAYDLLLEDVNDSKCGYAVSSDERGLIRQGKFIDCAC